MKWTELEWKNELLVFFFTLIIFFLTSLGLFFRAAAAPFKASMFIRRIRPFFFSRYLWYARQQPVTPVFERAKDGTPCQRRKAKRFLGSKKISHSISFFIKSLSIGHRVILSFNGECSLSKVAPPPATHLLLFTWQQPKYNQITQEGPR